MKRASKVKLKSPYRSGLEERFAEVVPRGMFKYEPFSIPYVVHHQYTPDFVYNDFYIECKGFFRAGDTQKYKAIKNSLVFEELVFVFSDPNKKVRKGGKMTLGQWCDKEGIKSFSIKEVDKLLEYINGSNT